MGEQLGASFLTRGANGLNSAGYMNQKIALVQRFQLFAGVAAADCANIVASAIPHTAAPLPRNCPDDTTRCAHKPRTQVAARQQKPKGMTRSIVNQGTRSAATR